MGGIKAGQGQRQAFAAAHERPDLCAKEGDGAGDLGADLGGPVAFLVPGQQIAGEAKGQHQKEQQHAGQPVDLRAAACSRKEIGAQHVQRYQYDHGAGAVVVDPPHQPAQRQDVGDEVNAVCRPLPHWGHNRRPAGCRSVPGA